MFGFGPRNQNAWRDVEVNRIELFVTDNVGHRFAGTTTFHPRTIFGQRVRWRHFFETRVQLDALALKCFGQQDFGVQTRAVRTHFFKVVLRPVKQAFEGPLFSGFSHWSSDRSESVGPQNLYFSICAGHEQASTP